MWSFFSSLSPLTLIQIYRIRKKRFVEKIFYVRSNTHIKNKTKKNRNVIDGFGCIGWKSEGNNNKEHNICCRKHWHFLHFVEIELDGFQMCMFNYGEYWNDMCVVFWCDLHRNSCDGIAIFLNSEPNMKRKMKTSFRFFFPDYNFEIWYHPLAEVPLRWLHFMKRFISSIRFVTFTHSYTKCLPVCIFTNEYVNRTHKWFWSSTE